MKKEYLTTTSVDGKEICLTAMARVSSPELIHDLLSFTFSDAVAIQDKHTSPMFLAANSKARYVLWEWVKANWETIHGALSANVVTIDRFVKTSLNKFASHEVQKDIENFFKDKQTKSYERGLAQVYDTVKANANYRERDGEIIKEWLAAHGYA